MSSAKVKPLAILRRFFDFAALMALRDQALLYVVQMAQQMSADAHALDTWEAEGGALGDGE